MSRAAGHRSLRQPVIQSSPQAPGGEIGISFAAQTDPDGYTLLHAPSVITLLPFVMKSISYDLARDFDPVVLVGLTQFCLVVSPSLPVRSVADLIALAKAKPGTLHYGSAGPGSLPHLSAAEFARMAGIELLRLIRKHPNLKSSPAMIVSYKDREEDRQRGLAHGAFSFLTKPVENKDLKFAFERIKAYTQPRRKTLVVIEDNEAELTGISALLGHDNVDIVSFTSGGEALAYLAAEKVSPGRVVHLAGDRVAVPAGEAVADADRPGDRPAMPRGGRRRL